MSLPALLGLGLGLLVALALGVLLGMSALKRNEQRQARILAVTEPHLPASVAPVVRPGLIERLQRSAFGPRLIALFGVDPELRGRYPVRWFVVLPVALVVARVLAGIVAALIGDVALLATFPLWPLLCRLVFARFHAAHRAKLFVQLPEALGLVTRATRVGIPAAEALRQVAKEAPEPTAGEFRRIADRLSIGQPLDRALADTALQNGVAEYRFFATAMSLQAQTGGALSEALENLSDVIRKRVALRQRALALASEARTSAAILAALPFAAGALLMLLNPSYVMVLFNDPGGQRVLAAALVMLGLGIGVMQATIKKSLS